MSDIKKDKKDMTVRTETETDLKTAFSSFLRGDHHSFVIQKTEKLASALYVVTGFVPNDDPLRTRLRTCALELVSTSTDPDRARDVRYHEGFASRCLEISSILTLAQRAGFISSMNARILCDEYADLATFVSEHRDKVFGVSRVDVASSPLPAPSQKGATHSSYSPKIMQGDKHSKTDNFKRTNNHKRHSNRRAIILSLLDKKDKITIKDACEAIEGCSEKTIQRELTALVVEGVLIKEGERRWSTYRKA